MSDWRALDDSPLDDAKICRDYHRVNDDTNPGRPNQWFGRQPQDEHGNQNMDRHLGHEPPGAKLRYQRRNKAVGLYAASRDGGIG